MTPSSIHKRRATLFALRESLSNVDVRDVISDSVDPTITTTLAAQVASLTAGPHLVPGVDLREVLAESESVWGVQPRHITNWCHRHVGDHYLNPLKFADVVLAALPHTLPLVFAQNAVTTNLSELQFDDDGLLNTSANAQVDLHKEGVLTRNSFLLYHPGLSEYNLGLSGGFLEKLIETSRDEALVVDQLSLAVDGDTVLDRQCHAPSFAKEYFYGPRCAVPEVLNDPYFPDNAGGTVTLHERVLSDEDLDWGYRDIFQLQVMWSRRDGLKSVQMEELVPVESKEFAHEDWVMNRYIHAQWNPKVNAIVHFDGAVKEYPKPLYRARLDHDRPNRADESQPRYRKLFRIDGELPFTTWKELVGLFFVKNELVIEYLESGDLR